MNGHHLILGKLTDYLSGRTIFDTHDERYRQKIARLLIEQKGYEKTEVLSRSELMVRAGTKRAIVKVDFKISLSSRICMLIKYGPGSLVTRERPALAASRLCAPYQIPFVVVTNGEDAELLDGSTGRVLARGIDAIPAREEIRRQFADLNFQAIGTQRAEMESRIIYAFEVDGSCPCDDNICRL